MKQTLPLSFLLVATSVAVSLSAQSATPSVGGHIATGGAEFNNSSADGDGVAQIYGYYNHALSDTFSVELGINVGTDIDEWDCYEDRHDDWHCSTNNHQTLFGLNVEEVEYANLVVALKAKAPLTQRNSLYAKFGGQFYDYELNRHRRTIYTDDGLGLYLAVGWQYQWDMGIGMSAGFERYDMDELVTTTTNIGISYQF